MPNILIVEDDININNLLCEVLMKAGYTCEQAFSGTEAKLLLNIKEKAYTLVLLDLMLPGASGEEVLKEIRKHGRLPVIVLTAKDSIDDKIGVLTDGADDYITKPFEIREVLARIQVQLRHIEVETKGEAEAETKVEAEAETEVKTKAGIQKGQGSGRLEFRDMVLTRSTFEVSIGGRVLPPSSTRPLSCTSSWALTPVTPTSRFAAPSCCPTAPVSPSACWCSPRAIRPRLPRLPAPIS